MTPRIRRYVVAILASVPGVTACGDASPTEPPERRVAVDLTVAAIHVLGSCDGKSQLDWLGTGGEGEVAYRLSAHGPDGDTRVLAGSEAFPGHVIWHAIEGQSTGPRGPYRFETTLRVGRVDEIEVVFEAMEWDGLPNAEFPDPRMSASEPSTFTLSSLDGFSPGTHILGIGTRGCRLQADVDVATSERS